MVSTSARGPRVSWLLRVAPLSDWRLCVPSPSCVYVSYRVGQRVEIKPPIMHLPMLCNIYGSFARMRSFNKLPLPSVSSLADRLTISFYADLTCVPLGSAADLIPA